jgi:TnpA family transposase
LANLIWLVNKKTHFFTAFTHILNKNASSEIDSEYVIAVIIAYGTNMGLKKMASCSGLSYNKLKKTSDVLFREETLKLANEIVINKTSKLPIQDIYNINNRVHASVDGKKYDASKNVFNSRYSSKYFGLGTGISVVTLVANFSPVGLKIISPSEYEGNFNLELLLMNESDIQTQIISTDMHGITDINHALHDYCGYDFQPHYTNIYKQAKTICCSRSAGDFPDNYIIKHIHKIDEDLYLGEEFNIKRIVASLLSKTGTVSTIVKKLNYSMKSNKTRKAIAEYNKVKRSIHILKMINALDYRQNMRIALNRGESYHFLTGAVGYANGGKITAKTEQEQLLFKECTRLICNIILYYNSYLLSQFYLEKLKAGQHKQIEALKRVSPNSWINVNLYGKYDLSKVSSHSSLNKLVELIKNESLIDDVLNEENLDEFETDDDS